MSKKESLIGKKYIPIDNSWSVNVTSCGDFLSKAKRSYLARSYWDEGKTCVIVSESFICNVCTTGVSEPRSTRKMIMVNYNNETHMVMFHETGIQK